MYIRLVKPKTCVAKKTKISSGKRKIPLLILSPKDKKENSPCVLWFHGGGLMIGLKELVYSSRALDLLDILGAVVVSVGYRLSVSHPYPAAVDDCYAALLWIKENAESLGIDPNKIIVGGESAGGGLCAAICMKARDEGSVKISYQLPLYPMLDNFDTSSSKDNHGKIWNTTFNHIAWKLYLRKDVKNEVEPYASPARQKDYRNLPPCYTFVGNGEPFLEETLSYVARLKENGVKAKVDVYETNVHAFDMLYPKLEISVKAAEKFREEIAKIFEEDN